MSVAAHRSRRAENRRWDVLAHGLAISISELAQDTWLALLPGAYSAIAQTVRSRLLCRRQSPTEAHVNVRTSANSSQGLMKIVRRRDGRCRHNAGAHVGGFNRHHASLVLQNSVHDQV